MKVARIIGIIAAALVLGAAAFFLYEKKRTSKPQAVCCGTLEVYPEFESAIISSRKVSVWLPDGYSVGDPCDVLYMHDGQMLFDSTATWNHQEWQVDEILSRLMDEKTIRRTIVVAIDNTPHRLKEYFPDKACQGLDDLDASELGGDNYLKFLVEEVKPFIDEHYQPMTDREHTFIMGSSMGGLISLYGLCEYPEVFGGAACLSSHVSMSHLKATKDTEAMADSFLQYVADHMPDANEARIYMDHGTEGFDSAYGPYQQRLDALFRERGWDADHFKSLVFEGHDHNETCWAKRLAEPITYLLGTPGTCAN